LIIQFVDAIGFVVAWVFVGIYNEKIHSERDGIPQQSQQNPLAKAIESLLPWGLTRILVVLEIVQRSFQWYHGPRTFVKDEAWRKFKKTQKWNKWILIILRLGSLFCFLWGPLASTWFLKQSMSYVKITTLPAETRSKG
jgi:hypothetical protein